MITKLEATSFSSSCIQTTPVQEVPLNVLERIKIEDSKKDLSQIAIEQRPVDVDEKTETAFRSALNSEALNKINENLKALSELQLPCKLMKDSDSPLLEILKMSSKEVSESKQLVVGYFRTLGVEDPFHFEVNLKFLLRNNEINKAFNLLSLQDHLVGFSSIQTISQDSFYNTGSTKDRGTRLGCYLRFVESMLKKEEDEEKRLGMALKAYSYFSFNPQIANSLEKEYLLGKSTLLFERVLESDEDLKASCKLALTSRINVSLKEAELKPGPVCTLIQFLSKISNDTVFIKESLVALLEKCGNSEKTPTAIRKIKEIFSKEIQQECFTGLLGLLDKKAGIADLILSFLDVASDKDKIGLARKCIVSKTCENLLQPALNALKDLKQAFKDSSPWPVNSLEIFFDVFSEKERIANILLDHISNSEFFTAAGIAFTNKLFPYLDSSVKDVWCDKCWKLVRSQLQSNKPITDYLPLITLMMGSSLEPLLLHPNQQKVLQEDFISFFINNLEKFNKILIDKKVDLHTETHRRNTLLIIEQVKTYGISLMSKVQKEQLLSKICDNVGSQISTFIPNLIDQTFDFDGLKNDKWDLKKLVRGFKLLVSHSHKEKYETFALTQVQNVPAIIGSNFLPYLSEASKEQVVLQLVDLINKDNFETYLSSILQVDSCFFTKNPKVYAAFLKIANLYVSPPDSLEKKLDFIKKIGEVVQSGEAMLPQLKESDQFLHQQVVFIYAVFLKNEGLASKQVNDCSDVFLEKFSKLTSQWDALYRVSFLKSLLKRKFPEKNPTLFLNSLYYQLVVLEKSHPSLIPHEIISDYLVQHLITLNPLDPNMGSKCSYLFRQVLLKTGQEKHKQMAFQLLKEVHSNRLKKEGINPNTELDLKAYLEFLQDFNFTLNEEMAKELEFFIDQQGLYKEDPLLCGLVKAYDNRLSYSHKNIIREFKLLQDDILPTTSPENMLSILGLRFLTGKYPIEDMLENICETLKMSFNDDPFLFSKSLSHFYETIYVEGLSYLHKENRSGLICLESAKMAFIENCYKEVLSIESIADINQEAFLKALFYKLRTIYRFAPLPSKSRGDSSLLDKIRKSFRVCVREISLELISKLTKFNKANVRDIVECLKLYENTGSANEIESVKVNLYFFKSLSSLFPEISELKECVEELEAVILKFSESESSASWFNFDSWWR